MADEDEATLPPEPATTSATSHAHKIESGITGVATLATPLILALAFRRIPAWRDSWLPSLIAVSAIILANIVFSAVGNARIGMSG